MQADASPIKTDTAMNPPFSRQDRLVYFVTISCAASILFIARLLRPSPTGVGTHEQLGLPACPFYHLTGLPCPSCGFTTCFAYGARFDLLHSFSVNPAGFLLFLFTALSIPFCLAFLSFRIAPRRVFQWIPIKLIAYGYLLLLLLSWAAKLISTKTHFLESLKNW